MASPARRSRAAAALAIPVLLLAALSAAAPVLAKEDLQATLDAPVPMGAPAGTVLLVGMTVVAPEGSVMHPVEGSPIYLKLIGVGDSSWALGRQDGTRGHYVMRIAVPPGGIQSIEVGIHGTSDLPIVVAGSPLVTGGITPRTAQVAPAAMAAAAPAAPATAPAAAPAGQPAPVPAVAPTAATASGVAAWVLGLAAVAAALAIVLAVLAGARAARRSGSAGHSAASGS